MRKSKSDIDFLEKWKNNKSADRIVFNRIIKIECCSFVPKRKGID